jgi:shikimate kinase
MNFEAEGPRQVSPADLLPPGKRQIHLTGFMGSGKSAVGRRLAEMLGWGFVDLDAAIAARAEKSVAQLFAEEGEAVFRALEDLLLLEVSVVARAEVGANGCVVALGGGTLMDPANRETCAAIATVVWLQCPLDIIVARSGSEAETRPLWGTPGELRDRYAEREPGYLAADLIVDGSGSVSEVANAVLDALRGMGQGT